MIRFSIRDIFWLTALVGIALLLPLEWWRHDGEIGRAQAKTQEVEQERNAKQWQLVSAAAIFEHAGYDLESDDGHVVVIGPFPQGHAGMEMTKEIKQGSWTGHCVIKPLGTKPPPLARTGKLIGGHEIHSQTIRSASAAPTVERR